MILKRLLLASLSLLFPLSCLSFSLTSPGEVDETLAPLGKASPREKGFDPVEEVEYEDDIPVFLNHIHVGETLRIPAVYSDEIFFKDPTVYHHVLAKQSMGLAMAASDFSTDEEDEKISGEGTLEYYLQDTGFEHIRLDDYDKETSVYTVATALGHKVIEKDGEKADLIIVAIRGAKYKNEWQSNLLLDTGLRHKGFNDAATLVTDRVISYIAQIQTDYPVKIWLTGFSRAGAVANLTAANLNDSQTYDKMQVYAYTFAAPRAVWNYEKDSEIHNFVKGYENIFNIVGASDLIPQFAPEEWHYHRYGQDKYLLGREFDSTFASKFKSVQMRIAEVGGKISYSPEVNLRVRLLYSYLEEMAADEFDFMAILQDLFVDILTYKETNKIAQTIRQTFILWRDYDPALVHKKDALFDYFVGITPDLLFGNGYLTGQTSSISNPLFNLLHEHSPEIYFYWLYTHSADEIFSSTKQFAYFTFTGKPTIILRNGSGNEILRFEKGERIDSTFAKDNLIDLYSSSIGDKTLLILPFDDTYVLSYEKRSGESFEANALIYGRFFHSYMDNYRASIDGDSPDSDVLINLATSPSEIAGRRGLVRGSEFASYLHINRGFFSFLGLIAAIVAFVATLIMVWILLFVFFRSKFIKKKMPWMRILCGAVAMIFVLEAEAFYWVASDRIWISFLFKLVAVTAMLLLYFHNKGLGAFKNAHRNILPSIVLFSLCYLSFSFSSMVAMIFFALGALFLSYHLYSHHPLKGDLWVTVIFLSGGVLALTAFLARRDIAGSIPYLILFPLMIFACVTGLKEGKKKMVATYLLLACSVMAWLDSLSIIPLLSSLIFIALFNLTLYLFAISEDTPQIATDAGEENKQTKAEETKEIHAETA